MHINHDASLIYLKHDTRLVHIGQFNSEIEIPEECKKYQEELDFYTSRIVDDIENPEQVKIVFAPHFLILPNDKFAISVINNQDDNDHILFKKKKLG